jgi:bidirectional [NiFe] hydrogenase diaphorase subunit
MKACLRVCTAASCRSRGGAVLQQSLSEAITSAGLEHRLSVKGVGCLGPCSDGPLLAMDSGPEAHPQLYGAIPATDIAPLTASLTQAATGGDLTRWCPDGSHRIDLNHPFFKLQRRLVLQHCGQIDPDSIEEAEAAGVYRQLQRVLQNDNPTALIEQVRRSGLRGRGGAGYPTGLKWDTVAKMPGTEKLVVCNADEGDPGAFMDRTVMEGDPHTVLEGMAIAAHAVGANRGFIYVRAEYPLAIARLRTAIAAAHRHGWLGAGIAGSRFNFDVTLRVGAGAYVCGEETALIQSIEGKRGMPRPRPPYPAERGVFGLPTLINNVETFANLPALLRLGLENYGSGTKVFSLTGDVIRTGVIEVPMGTSIRTIVETMGGGAPAGRSIKAVQTGGPSGGCVPTNQLDTPVDYESLQALGTIMGSGGMVVMDDTTNMVDIARFFMAFCREESCGKCVPCRAGTVQLDNLLVKILEGSAAPGDLQQLEHLCHMVKDTSLCGLGQCAPKPVLSTLRHFRDDYLALVPAETHR